MQPAALIADAVTSGLDVSAQIFVQPRHAYTRELRDAIPLPEPDPGWLEREAADA